MIPCRHISLEVYWEANLIPLGLAALQRNISTGQTRPYMSVCVAQTSQKSANRDKLLNCLKRIHFIDTRFQTEKLSGYGKDATLCILINNLSRRTATIFIHYVLSGTKTLKISFLKTTRALWILLFFLLNKQVTWEPKKKICCLTKHLKQLNLLLLVPLCLLLTFRD